MRDVCGSVSEISSRYLVLVSVRGLLLGLFRGYSNSLGDRPLNLKGARGAGGAARRARDGVGAGGARVASRGAEAVREFTCRGFLCWWFGGLVRVA